MSVFTSVFNVDERCLSRDRIHYGTDSSTMVCDNSVNVHICNWRNMFVGEIRKFSNQQVATIGGKGHQFQASAQSNEYGLMTPENHTSTLLKMYYFSTISNQRSERNLFCTTVE